MRTDSGSHLLLDFVASLSWVYLGLTAASDLRSLVTGAEKRHASDNVRHRPERM